MRLFDFLFLPRADEIAVRDISTDDFLTKVSPSLVPYTRPATVVLMPFHDPVVRSAIHEAKYHGNERAFELLALALTDYLRDADDVGRTTSNICLVPVPLGKERRKERGFNQVEEVARRVAKEFKIQVKTKILVRTRETTSQISLPREEREKNLRGAFIVSPKLEERRRIDPTCTYILVDDVITTGATLQSAIDALKDAGASHIIPLALAH